MVEYETVIGLETHARLSTETKIFCACPSRFGSKPNESTCPVCLGLPGALPRFNMEVARRAVALGLATGCSIRAESRFARKSYFYPDLPKGYQISQFEDPILENGSITIETEPDGASKTIRIKRIHMEEDAGKLIHGENLGSPSNSYVDLNRAGSPLLEIVTEPDISSAAEAKAYLEKLKVILEYLDISDCNMEEGSFRCDVNISLRPKGSDTLGERAELKNMNSFRFLTQAIEYEIERQRDALESGRKVLQETRLYNPEKRMTFPMRQKEDAHDYRYFPDPDLPPLKIASEWIERIKAAAPEYPDQRRARFEREYALGDYDARLLTSSRALADYYEATVDKARDIAEQPKRARIFKSSANWILGDLMKELKDRSLDPTRSPIAPSALAKMIEMIDSDEISGKIGKIVIAEMAATGEGPDEIVARKGLAQISSEKILTASIERVLARSAENVALYKSGKEKLLGWFVGQVMKETKGKANPALVNKMLKEALD